MFSRPGPRSRLDPPRRVAVLAPMPGFPGREKDTHHADEKG